MNSRMSEYASFRIFGGTRGLWLVEGWCRWCCVWTMVISLLFCQIQGKCMYKHSVHITVISNKANIRKRQISKNDLGWWRGILGWFDLWFAAVIGFVHDLTVGPCTHCILKEQYKKSWTHLHHLVKNQWCWHLV